MQVYAVRLKQDERELITKIAQELERDEPDAVRFVLRDYARQLGLLPSKSLPARCGRPRKKAA
jgi:hypothetical protein